MSYFFEDFELDDQKRLLYKNGEMRHLQTKAFETLLILVENREKLVTKEELLERIWPNRYVEESNLAQKIFIIRQVLGERKEDHRFIVTIPGEGYIFVAPVTGEKPSALSPPANIDFRYPRTVSKKKSLAVLPFTELSRQSEAADDNFLGIGLADSLTTNLFNYQDINIRSSRAALKYVGKNSDLKTIAAELQVHFLITGFVQKVNDDLKISVQLTSFPTETAVWAGSWNVDSVNLFQAQSVISEDIAGVLALELKREAPPVNYGDTDVYEAYLSYTKSRYYWNLRTVEGLKQSINCIHDALALDPTFAKAYVGLADSYILLAAQHNYLAPREAFPKAKSAARRALEICPDLAEAFSSLGFIAYIFDWEWELAENYFQRAIRLNPNYPTTFHWYGEALATRGEFNRSEHFLRRAGELDPLSLPIAIDLAQNYYYARKYAEGERCLKQIIDMNPEYARGHFLHGLIYRQTGRLPKAIKSFEKAAALSPQDTNILAELALTQAASGHLRSAENLLSELLGIRGERYASALNISTIYLEMGDQKAAADWLQTAIDERDIWLVWAGSFPKFNSCLKALKQAGLA